jgi:hypothetical protein
VADALAVDDDLEGSSSPGYAHDAVQAAGECRSKGFKPEGFPLQMIWSRLSPGATLRWDPHPGDEVVYVHEGMVGVAGVEAPAGSAVLVDSGAAPEIEAKADTVLLHFGLQEPTEEGTRRRTAVIGPTGVYALVEEGRDTHFYAQSDDDFSATFFFTGRTGQYRSQAHRHSADEILCVLTGGISLGAKRLPALSAIAVPGDRLYGFVSDPEGFGMINYRREVSYYSGSDGKPPFREGVGAAAGLVAVDGRLA